MEGRAGRQGLLAGPSWSTTSARGPVALEAATHRVLQACATGLSALVSIQHPDALDTPARPPGRRPGRLTVNIGDGLTRWTDGIFKSTYHRVRAPKAGDPTVRLGGAGHGSWAGPWRGGFTAAWLYSGAALAGLWSQRGRGVWAAASGLWVRAAMGCWVHGMWVQ